MKQKSKSLKVQDFVRKIDLKKLFSEGDTIKRSNILFKRKQDLLKIQDRVIALTNNQSVIEKLY